MPSTPIRILDGGSVRHFYGRSSPMFVNRFRPKMSHHQEKIAAVAAGMARHWTSAPAEHWFWLCCPHRFDATSYLLKDGRFQHENMDRPGRLAGDIRACDVSARWAGALNGRPARRRR